MLHISLAHDENTGILVGYCVSTVTENKGEIDSIFIDPEYRKNGIGNSLMQRALNWMNNNSVTRKTLNVGAGNDEVFEFYSRYRFYPYRIILEQVD
ncbi:GNAT family N-acetyltransferase [Chloroflexota bacterium]